MRRTKRFGRYHLTERIAFGGMAEIFRGFTYDAEGFRRDVAIKKLLPEYVEDKNFITMLTDEFKLVSHLQHPNIAEVYELVEVDGTLLIAMEFVDGKDLRSTVEKAREGEHSLELDDMAYVMARTLDGMHHAHVARDLRGAPLRIVHRDLSPSNMLMAYDGTVKICDFGIAKATHSRVETKAGIIKGKVKYMSPEQAFGRKLDWRSDLFSAGSVLYELCTGQAPFNAPNEVDLIYAVRGAEPVPCQHLNAAIPDELAAIIDKSMSRSKSGRFQSGMAFRDALIAFLLHHNPRYKRTKLARHLRELWSAEIERELRTMEDLVLDESPAEDMGRNLIAEALGPNATYAKFAPHPTGLVPDPAALEASALSEVRTDIVEVPPVSTSRTEPRPRADDAMDGDEDIPDDPTKVSPPR